MGSLGLATSQAGAPTSRPSCNSPTWTWSTSLSEMIGIKRIEGKGTIAVAVDASGATVLALTRTLSGTATLTGRQGALTGLQRGAAAAAARTASALRRR